MSKTLSFGFAVFCVLVSVVPALATDTYVVEPGTETPPNTWEYGQPEGGTLWDNGLPNGINGYGWSQDGNPVVGAQRRLLDDFTIPHNFWRISGFHFFGVPGSPTDQPPWGLDFEIQFREDDNGTPGAVIAGSQRGPGESPGYSEAATGGVLFSRPEYEGEYIWETRLGNAHSYSAGAYFC